MPALRPPSQRVFLQRPEPSRPTKSWEAALAQRHPKRPRRQDSESPPHERPAGDEGEWVDADSVDDNAADADDGGIREGSTPVARRSGKSDPKDDAPEVAGIRVIGGKNRGRKLAYSGDVRTRPMKDRVREALFNLLGKGVEGTVAIDLFAGTGALGIEALSRGAGWGIFLEKHFPTCQLIEANLKAVGMEGRGQAIGGDTFLQLRMMRRDGRTFAAPPDATKLPVPVVEPVRWIVFCSPPYEFYISREAEMLRLLDDIIALAPPGSAIVVEADDRFDPTKLPEPELWDVRRYYPAVVIWRQFPL